MKLAPSGRSDSHSVRALRAANSHPCGAGLHSNGRGAAPALNLCRAFFQMHILFDSLSLSGGVETGAFQKLSAHCVRIQMRRVFLSHFVALRILHEIFCTVGKNPKGRGRAFPASGLRSVLVCPRALLAAPSAVCLLLLLVRIKSVCYTEEKQGKEQANCFLTAVKNPPGGVESLLRTSSRRSYGRFL